ncbi:MAG: hypothetical protein JWN28_352 [Candidatus Saccharibacteria bacterium]|nr:hypothetical protein [Candidatus Saccharibacteria bacterium]
MDVAEPVVKATNKKYKKAPNYILPAVRQKVDKDARALFVAYKRAVAKFPRKIRTFAVTQLSAEPHSTISEALQGGSLQVAALALKYKVSEETIKEALDVLALIRKLSVDNGTISRHHAE